MLIGSTLRAPAISWSLPAANPGQFWRLPVKAPQTPKQLLMVWAGTDRYLQIVKCFRDRRTRVLTASLNSPRIDSV